MPYLEQQLRARRRKMYRIVPIFVLAALIIGWGRLLYEAGGFQALMADDVSSIAALILPLAFTGIAVLVFGVAYKVSTANCKRAYKRLLPWQLERCDAQLEGKDLFKQDVATTDYLVLVNQANYDLHLIPGCEIERVEGPFFKKGAANRVPQRLQVTVRIVCRDEKFNCTISKVVVGNQAEFDARRDYAQLVAKVQAVARRSSADGTAAKTEEGWVPV